MTPEQALAILDQSSAMAPMVRADHFKTMRAVHILGNTLKAAAVQEAQEKEAGKDQG